MALAFDATLGTVTDTDTLTTSAAAASGSRVFVFIWWYEAPSDLTGVSGGGLTWVIDHQGANPADSANKFAIVSADAPSGLASSTVITPSFDAGNFGPGIAAHSWTGVETGASGYVDATCTARQQFASTWATNSITTTLADTLIFGVCWSSAGTHTAATDYTERHEWTAEGSNLAAVVSRVVSSASTYTPGGTWAGGSDVWSIGLAYEAAAGGEPPPDPPTLYVTQKTTMLR